MHDLLMAGDEMGQASHAYFSVAFTNKNRGREENKPTRGNVKHLPLEVSYLAHVIC